MRRNPTCATVTMQMLRFLKHKLPVGAEVTDGDWNTAYEVVWATNAIDTQLILNQILTGVWNPKDTADLIQ